MNDQLYVQMKTAELVDSGFLIGNLRVNTCLIWWSGGGTIPFYGGVLPLVGVLDAYIV